MSHKECGFDDEDLGDTKTRTRFRRRSRPYWHASNTITHRTIAEIASLDGESACAEPKKLRYRLLHVAARITRTA